MINRQIKYNPKEVLSNFDWFNDYQDTRRWAKFSCPEVIPDLDEGYQKWLEQRESENGQKT